MRSVLAMLIVAAGVAVAVAQPGSQPATQPQPAAQPAPQPGQPPATPAGQPTAVQPVTPPAPKGIPVPEMPIIERKELEGGLIVEDMKVGNGYEVKPGDTVVAFYHGTLKDAPAGTPAFDSAFERGEPIAFSLNGVIQGWQKGVPGMKVGGIRKLTIPYALAYGEAGSPPKIPAKADLVFVIQLDDALHWEDISPGTGEEIWGMAVGVVKQTITPASGEKVTHDNPPYVWLPGEMRYSPRDDAMQLALKGMKVGGKRKIHIPKQLNNSMPEVTNRPTGVTCDIELELVAARNLAPKPQPTPPPTAVPVPNDHAGHDHK